MFDAQWYNEFVPKQSEKPKQKPRRRESLLKQPNVSQVSFHGYVFNIDAVAGGH